MNFSRLIQKWHFKTVTLLDKFGLKSIAKRVLRAFGLTSGQVGILPEQLAANFYRNSQLVGTPSPVLGENKRVLFLAGRAYDKKFPTTEGLLAWALKIRGADPTFLICDGFLTACELSTVNDFSSQEAFAASQKATRCQDCYIPGSALFEAYGWQTKSLSQYVHSDDWQKAHEIALDISVQDAFALVHNSIPIGEQIEATAYRTLLSALLGEDEPTTTRIVRRLTVNAVVLAEAVPRAFEALRPDHVVAHHGIYLTAGIACEYARRNGIPVVNWTVPYRRGTVLFSHNDTYHRTMISEPTSDWEQSEFADEHRKMLREYLNSHWKSGWDLVSYNRDTDDDPQRIVNELHLDTQKPIIGLYTNLAWDARIHYAGNTFANHSEWLLQTVSSFIERPRVQLVIRVHPAEVKSGLGPVRQRADELIAQYYPQLPAHIHVISPESPLSSYALMRLTKANVVFGTKLGLEMAALGLPVVVAGEAWFRGKGFTYDPQNIEEYIDWLSHPDKLKPLGTDQIERAQRYAYHFYFRRNVSFPSLVYHPDAYLVDSIDDLKPGEYPNLDVICDGILYGSSFIAKTPQ